MSDEFIGINSKVDAADFQRQLEEAANIPVTTEIRAIITGSLDAQAKMKEARERALLIARKKLVQRVYAEHEKMRHEQHLMPWGANVAVKEWLDEGPLKVEP